MGLYVESANDMWNGEGSVTAERSPMSMHGHWYVQGTCEMALQFTDNFGLALQVTASLMFDMDPANDGSFSPFAKGDARQPDFAFMLQGEAKPVIKLPKNKELDLGGLITALVDMYVEVNGQESELKFGASIEVSMQKVCDASPV